MFNKEQLLVMCNIIAALESEDQVYHTRENSIGYGAFAEAYENSAIEDSVTLGRYQFFRNEGLKLMKMIYAKDKSLFTQEIINDINTNDWTNYNISRNSSKAQTIIKIISSPVGKEAQDELVGQQMQEYAKYVEQYGVTDVQAQALAVNWIHQGGKGAFTRILAKTPKPYTLDNLYNASKSDTGNQVGNYRSRQLACYNMIKQYMPTTSTTTSQPTTQTQTTYEINPGTSAEDILNIMRGWIGLNQYDGSHMQIVNIYNNHRPLAMNYALSSTDSWCACTVSTAFIVADAVDIIGGTECGVDRMIESCFKPIGIWIEDGAITPIPGDIITFNWDQSYQPNNGFADHIGIVEYVEGGFIHTIEGNSGGRVRRCTYVIGDGNIRGFARPKYDGATTTVKITPPETGSTITMPSFLKKGDKGDDVVTLQKMLIACGYDCGGFGADGDFGNGTEASLKAFQKDKRLTITGTYTIETKIKLEKAYDLYKSKSEFPKTMHCIKTPATLLRQGASKSKQIITRLPVGTEVVCLRSKVNSKNNLWYKVNVPSTKQTGWIVASALSE